MSGCGNDDNKDSSESDKDGQISAVSTDSSVSAPVDTSTDTLYPIIVITEKEAREKLVNGMWLYMDGTKFGISPKEYVPHADRDAWYFGSYLDLSEDGKGMVNIGGYDSTLTYVINDDLTIDITHGNPEVIDQFMLGSDDEYGEILYSTEDENIRFYHETFED